MGECLSSHLGGVYVGKGGVSVVPPFKNGLSLLVIVLEIITTRVTFRQAAYSSTRPLAGNRPRERRCGLLHNASMTAWCSTSSRGRVLRDGSQIE